MSAGCDLPELVRTSSEPFAVCRLPEFGHSIVQFQPHTMLRHVAFDEYGHFRIERRHDLSEPFNQRHFQSAMNEVFHHFQADESTANDHRPLRFRHRLVARVRVHTGLIRSITIQPCSHVPGVRNGSD